MFLLMSQLEYFHLLVPILKLGDIPLLPLLPLDPLTKPKANTPDEFKVT